MSWTAFIPLVGNILDRVLPDTAEKERMKQQALADLQKAITDQNIEQIKVNREEAKSGNLYLSAWRPTVAWIGVAGLFITVLKPFIDYILTLNGLPALPFIPTEDLTILLYGLLGLGGLRSFDKYKNTDTKGFK